MGAEDGVLTIRSYRVCFDLERRIHRLDRWQLPFPYGVPIAGIGWALAVLLMVLLGSTLPLVAVPIVAVPVPVRLVAVPIVAAFVLTRWRIDGRSPFAAGQAWACWRLQPRRLVAFRAVPEPGTVTLGNVTFVDDGRGARLRRGIIQGPARVLLRYPAELHERRRTLVMKPATGGPRFRGTEIRLRRGQRLVVSR